MSSSSSTESDTDSSSSYSSSTSNYSLSGDWSTEEITFLGSPPPKRQKKEVMDAETEISHEHVMKVNFKWKIENFSQICNSRSNRDKIVSPNFTMGPNDEFTWCLQIYPKGPVVSHKNYLSIYLLLVSSTESRVKVNYKFTILNSKKRLSSPVNKSSDNIFSKGERHGYKQLVKTDLLKNLDVLILEADLTVRNTNTNSTKIKMIDYLKDLFENSKYSDAVLKVENKEFKVHQCILASRSPYFAGLFQHDMIEKGKNSVEIKDISEEVMNELLRFAYTGDIHNLNKIARDLLAAANKFLFEDLKIICEAELFNSLTVDNVVEIYSFAEMHNALKLKEKAFDFLVKHMNQVIKTPSFDEEIINHPILQREAMKELSKRIDALENSS